MDAQMAINEVSQRGFQILKAISISPNKYIYDLSFMSGSAGDSTKLYVAVETNVNSDRMYASSIDASLCLCIESYLCTIGYGCYGEVLLSIESTIKKITYSNDQVQQCPWFPSHLTNGYIPHGIAKSKSGHLLISLWNHKPR
ncbi:uncharacterized protein LOC134275013 [Saccostrea cucullata]|uniref:uncharacterized protein LOC134275013 n=1 Tax=Saccostrea cuccullata TaxID=36930 RepID=UPI002ECFD290